MTKNEGTVDRAARVALAVVLAVVGFGVIQGTAGLIVGLVALVPLATGLSGWCPLYSLLHLNTNKGDSGRPSASRA